MRRRVVVGNDSPHRLRTTDVPHILLRLIVAVQTDERSAQDGVVEVGAERAVGEVEQHVGAVALHADVEVSRDRRDAGFQWKTWDGHCEWRVAAELGAGGGCRSQIKAWFTR
jgi:hypothetical protein